MTSQTTQPSLDTEEVVQVALSILLTRHPALVAFEELVAEFPQTGSTAVPDSVIHDAIDELVRLRLAHRLEQFVFASHTAVRVNELGG